MALKMILASTFAVLAFIQVAASRELFQSDCEDDTCMDQFAKCGGTWFNVSTHCCDPADSCVVKNFFYAQCLSEDKAAINVANGWDGTVLDCEEMPEDVIGGPMDAPESRKLLDMDGSYGGVDCDDDSCGDLFDKCGGGYNTSTACCDPELSCVVKNWFYAQCLSEERAALNVVNEGWDGRVLMCEEMPDDASKGPMSWDFEKTAADVEYVVSRKLQDSMPMGANCEDDTCAATFEKCGGTYFNSSIPCCEDNAMCVVKNYFYAQCLTSEDAEKNIDMWGWDGRALDCEEMPEELMPEGAEDMFDEEGMYGDGASRRMLQDSTSAGYGMGYGTKGGYGSGMPTSYGSRDFDFTAEAPGPAPVEVDMQPEDEPQSSEEMPAEDPMDEPVEEPATAPVTADTKIIESDLVLGEGCEECAPIFGQCADKGDIVSCCGEGLQCTKKNGFYAQCLPPARAERNIENFDWDGAILECGNVLL